VALALEIEKVSDKSFKVQAKAPLFFAEGLFLVVYAS
jgi:hypothetical protein